MSKLSVTNVTYSRCAREQSVSLGSWVFASLIFLRIEAVIMLFTRTFLLRLTLSVSFESERVETVELLNAVHLSLFYRTNSVRVMVGNVRNKLVEEVLQWTWYDATALCVLYSMLLYCIFVSVTLIKICLTLTFSTLNIDRKTSGRLC